MTDRLLSVDSEPGDVLVCGWIQVTSLLDKEARKQSLMDKFCVIYSDGILEISDGPTEPVEKRIILSESKLTLAAPNTLLKSFQLCDIPWASPQAFILDPLEIRTSRFNSITDSHTALQRRSSLKRNSGMQMSPHLVSSPRADPSPGQSQRASQISCHRTLRTANGLGLIMVTPREGGWRAALLKGCRVVDTRDKRRAKVKRWFKRTWLFLTGKLDKGDAWEDSDTDNESFYSATEEQAEEWDGMAQELQECISEFPENYATESIKPFRTFEAMLKAPEQNRLSTPPCRSEFNSMFDTISGLSASTPGWDVCTDKEGVYAIKSLDLESGLVRVKTLGKIPNVPPQVVWQFIYDTNIREKWDTNFRFFKHSGIRDAFSGERFGSEGQTHSLDIVFACVASPIGISDREFLEWRRASYPPRERPDRSGAFSMFLRSCDYPNAPPVGKGAVRADVLSSGYVLEWLPDHSGTEVIVYSQIDIKGLIPKTIVNLLAPSTPLKWIKRLRASTADWMTKNRVSLDDTQDKLDALVSSWTSTS